jgi:hypothetical protein
MGCVDPGHAQERIPWRRCSTGENSSAAAQRMRGAERRPSPLFPHSAVRRILLSRHCQTVNLLSSLRRIKLLNSKLCVTGNRCGPRARENSPAAAPRRGEPHGGAAARARSRVETTQPPPPSVGGSRGGPSRGWHAPVAAVAPPLKRRLYCECEQIPSGKQGYDVAQDLTSQLVQRAFASQPWMQAHNDDKIPTP